MNYGEKQILFSFMRYELKQRQEENQVGDE